MSTFGQVIDRICDDANRSDLSSQVRVFINRAIMFYEKEPFWFKEGIDTFSTTAGRKNYDTSSGVASDIKRIHYAEVEKASVGYELTQRDIAWIENTNPNNSQGMPSDYTWWQNEIWLGQVPNESLTVRLYYTKKYDALSATSSTNDWLTYAEDLIEARARKQLYARVIKNEKNAVLAQAEEAEALEALRSKNEDYASGQKVEPTCF